MMRFLVIFVFLMVPAAAWAQTGSIEGVILGDDGTVVTGAVVRLDGDAAVDTTDVSGRFGFADVPVGEHLVVAEKPGSILTPGAMRVTVASGGAATITIRFRERMYAVDEVVIVGLPPSGNSLEEDVPAQVDVITRAEFEHSAVTVEDVIAATPSARISSYGGLGSFSEVSLRGSYTNQVQVYLDGMLLNSAAGGPVNLGLIPLTNVERIEVWRSGAPARFGGDSAGGAINIVTREQHGGGGSVSVGYGSFGTVTASGIMGFGPADGRLTVTVDAATSQNDFEYTSDNGTPRNAIDDYTTGRRNNEFRTLNGLVKYRRLVSTGLALEVADHILSSRKNLPASQHLLDSTASLETVKNLLETAMIWSPSSSPWFEAVPAFHVILTSEHYRDRDGRVGWGNQDNVYNTMSYEGRIPVTVRHGGWGEASLTGVAGHEGYDPDHRLETVPPLSSNREHLGIVGDASLHTPGNLAAVTLNIRRDRYFSDYDGQPNPFTPITPAPVFHHLTNMQMGVTIRPHELVSVRWNYGDNWRMPSFYELFGDRGGMVSKPGLRPEHVYRWDAGVRFMAPDWTGHLAGRLDIVRFDSDYHDIIQWYANSYGFVEPDNVARSYVRGTEIVWNLRLFGSLDIRGSWTFQRSKVTDAARSYHVDKSLANRPERYGSAVIEYTHGRVALSWTLDRKGPYFLDRANQPHMRYPGRTVQDAALSFGFREGVVVVRLAIENVTDERTFDIQGMPKPGRSFFTTVTCSL